MVMLFLYFSLDQRCSSCPVNTPLFIPHFIPTVQAEELMKKIEKEEEQISNDDPNKKVFHHCIVNLVIG